jgi:predicted O-linked N-acetylglucosamine transferase (SPINDLY family)
MSRQQAGLPESGIVLCSFNNSYKISPQRFATWMSILQALPDSVLWLLDGKTTATAENLKQAAAAHQIDPDRLILMPKRPHDEYLECLSLADLFLDTSPYNAHTTASDALWAGCPVLTLPGQTFASRVAASLLTAAGLGEALICDSEEEYQARAVALGRDAGARTQLRAQLRKARESSPLFDTQAFCQQMSALMSQLIEARRSSSARH